MDEHTYEITIKPVKNGFIVECTIDRDYDDKEVYIESTTDDVGKRVVEFLDSNWATDPSR